MHNFKLLILDGIYLQIAGAVPIGILIRSGVNLINGSVLPPSLLILSKTESYKHQQEINQFHNLYKSNKQDGSYQETLSNILYLS